MVTDDGECEGIWKEKTYTGIRRKIIYNDSIIYHYSQEDSFLKEREWDCLS
ncbi:hypothetical protein bcere0004_56690 [Bacillus cereus BGSC 6E1]|nr:hypothetical protein bcere0004_56690 [Bacillus cereus BGSC 6E1]